MQRLPVRIELTNYDPDKEPLFVGLSVVPYVYINEPPAGPDAGKVLQPNLHAAPARRRPISRPNRAGPAERPSPRAESDGAKP